MAVCGDDEADTVLGLKAAGKDDIITQEYSTYTDIKTALKLDISVTIKQIQSSETTNP